MKNLASAAAIRRTIDETIERRLGCAEEPISDYLTTDHVARRRRPLRYAAGGALPPPPRARDPDRDRWARPRRRHPLRLLPRPRGRVIDSLEDVRLLGVSRRDAAISAGDPLAGADGAVHVAVPDGARLRSGPVDPALGLAQQRAVLGPDAGAEVGAVAAADPLLARPSPARRTRAPRCGRARRSRWRSRRSRAPAGPRASSPRRGGRACPRGSRAGRRRSRRGVSCRR